MKGKHPNLIHAESLKNWDCQVGLKSDGRWVMARPISCPTFIERIKLAWGVYTGKYDALKWEGQ